MKILLYLSNLIIPVFLFGSIAGGLAAGRDVYSDFLDGAGEGLRVVYRMIPTLVGLLVSVGVLRASGFLEGLAGILGMLLGKTGFPPEVMPLTIVRLFSSSAANGLLLDLFKKYGVDSFQGILGALILSSTESIFYCVSVYFGAVKIKKTGTVIPGALLSVTAAAAAGYFLTKWMLGI